MAAPPGQFIALNNFQIYMLGSIFLIVSIIYRDSQLSLSREIYFY